MYTPVELSLPSTLEVSNSLTGVQCVDHGVERPRDLGRCPNTLSECILPHELSLNEKRRVSKS